MGEQAEKLTQTLFYKGWGIPILFILILTITVHFLLNRLFKKFSPKIDKTSLHWDSSLVKALFHPLKIAIWILGLSFSLQVLAFHVGQDSFYKFFRPFQNFALISLGAWFVLRFIKNMEAAYTRSHKKQQKKYDKTTVRAVCQISRIVVFSIAILIYLQSQNINISAILAFGGAGGLIVGLAAKDLLANFFGGLMIYLDRPFSVGDWIRSADREIEGFVESIGWRLTKIRTFSKRLLYVPNGLFSTICVENPSRMSNRQIKTRIGIRYKDAEQMESIVSNVEEMIRNHPEIDTDKFLMVRFDEFGPSSLNFLIYCFTKTTAWADYKLYQQDIYLKVIAIIDKHGAQCAFPTTTLDLPDGLLPSLDLPPQSAR